jgi:hypothetical protein
VDVFLLRQEKFPSVARHRSRRDHPMRRNG